MSGKSVPVVPVRRLLLSLRWWSLIRSLAHSAVVNAACLRHGIEERRRARVGGYVGCLEVANFKAVDASRTRDRNVDLSQN